MAQTALGGGVLELRGHGMVGCGHSGLRLDVGVSGVFSNFNDSESEAKWGWVEPYRPPASTPAMGW